MAAPGCRKSFLGEKGPSEPVTLGGHVAPGRKRMTHEHGNEYQVRIVHEDETEELSGWMNCPEEVYRESGAK
jgi:hypothetical protein